MAALSWVATPVPRPCDYTMEKDTGLCGCAAISAATWHSCCCIPVAIAVVWRGCVAAEGGWTEAAGTRQEAMGCCWIKLGSYWNVLAAMGGCCKSLAAAVPRGGSKASAVSECTIAVVLSLRRLLPTMVVWKALVD
ncbi:hypothetical protein L3X38_011172 [Prunus dulcis]|uniref:Uncharacterized protein n=1 Tax=Prunus dulcis TaxID=3755 RepID=A0AAD4ZF61_PRUDU|nr:hypothetical protein L3X38_011172 [Prunus dulcis]